MSRPYAMCGHGRAALFACRAYCAEGLYFSAFIPQWLILQVLACYMLKRLPEYSDASIVRSRDPETLKPCDIVVDVGGVYDPSTHRYDHHQRSKSIKVGK